MNVMLTIYFSNGSGFKATCTTQVHHHSAQQYNIARGQEFRNFGYHTFKDLVQLLAASRDFDNVTSLLSHNFCGGESHGCQLPCYKKKTAVIEPLKQWKSTRSETRCDIPSDNSFVTFASLIPFMAHSSRLVARASASTVLMPPSFNFLMSAAEVPSSCNTVKNVTGNTAKNINHRRKPSARLPGAARWGTDRPVPPRAPVDPGPCPCPLSPP